MKNLLAKTLVAFVLFATCLTHQAKAQEAGDLNFTAGIGWSLIGAIFDVVDQAGVDGSGTPVINIMGDYSLSDLFSLGGAASFQSYTVKYDDTQGDYRDRLTCINIGIRPLIHLTRNSEELDVYVGARAGYTVWTSSTTFDGTGDYNPEENYDLSAFGLQPLGGVTYYFSNVGVNFELAPIGTYLAAIGVKVKL